MAGDLRQRVKQVALALTEGARTVVLHCRTTALLIGRAIERKESATRSARWTCGAICEQLALRKELVPQADAVQATRLGIWETEEGKTCGWG